MKTYHSALGQNFINFTFQKKMNFNDSAGHNLTTGDRNTHNDSINNANGTYYPQQREAETIPTHYHQNPHLYGPPASRSEHFLESLTGGKIQWEASVFALSTLALALGVLGKFYHDQRRCILFPLIQATHSREPDTLLLTLHYSLFSPSLLC